MNFEITGGYIVTPQESSIKVERKDIYIQDGIIRFQKPFNKADRKINAENKVILPGLVNAHHHIYSTLSKGVPCRIPFINFEGNLKNLWWTLDHSLNKEDMLLSTAITMKDCLKNGVTTVFDHHIANYTENALSDMSEIFKSYGINGTIAFELSDRNGTDFFQKSLEENIRFAKTHQQKQVKGMIGLHALFTLSDQSLQKIAENTNNFPIHIHIAEGEIDEIQSKEKYGITIIERLNKFGLLRNNSLLVHCSNINEKEIDILKTKNIFIVQALDSNLNNALNIGNISKFIDAGIKTTVGTDGMTSNIMKAYKNTFIFTKYQNKTPDIGYPEMNALFLNSFKLKKVFGFPIGIIEEEPADIAIFDYEPATPFNTDKFLDHFIFGITESFAQYVIKNDVLLLDDYHLTKNLYPNLFARSKEISKAMFKKFEANKGRY